MAAKKLVGMALLVAVALLSAACSGGTEVKESKSGDKVAKVEQVSDADLEAYLDAFASGDPSEMDKAKSLASSGSIAEAYLIHQGAVANASLDGGHGTFKQKLSKVDNGYKLCSVNVEEENCGLFADFKSAAGKLSSFSVDGRDLADRLALGTGDPIKAGDLATADFISSYKSSGNDLAVVFDVKSSGQKLNIGLFEATYRAPDGRQSTANYADGPLELGADSKATILVAFEKAEPGGKVTLTIADENYTTEKSITVKTR